MTLNRPKALNALTEAMAAEVERTLDAWRDDPAVVLVIIDAEGDKAFCAGGDIADLYARGRAGDFAFGQDFWRREYRLNLKIAEYPKPIVTFLQGFTMGGGVGVGCHASHRLVGESSAIAMPECGIGLIPDVGGSMLLGRAQGNVGLYYGLTGARMAAADAINIGFADHFVPAHRWSGVKDALIATGSTEALTAAVETPPGGALTDIPDEVLDCFGADTVAAITSRLEALGTEPAAKALKGLSRGSPLALACALVTIRAAKAITLPEALAQEYRFTYRAQEHGDFLEGIRAKIIDKDNAPNWLHPDFHVPQAQIEAMLAPLGDAEWSA